ncbi:MAG: cytochrome c oxidase subunit 3 [Gilvibacter sp.]
MTEQQLRDRRQYFRAKRHMLWFGIGSLVMGFAAFTSAYLVSRERDDWLNNYELPTAFYYSTLVIVLSSVTMYLAYKAVKKEQNSKGMALLWITFILGVVFGVMQFMGFDQIIKDFGYNFTGATSSISYTYVYLIAVVHLAHIFAALIALSVVIYNHYKLKYTQGQTLGIELAATFWHFVDFLWLYLFFFLYFFR